MRRKIATAAVALVLFGGCGDSEADERADRLSEALGLDAETAPDLDADEVPDVDLYLRTIRSTAPLARKMDDGTLVDAAEAVCEQLDSFPEASLIDEWAAMLVDASVQSDGDREELQVLVGAHVGAVNVFCPEYKHLSP